MTKFLLVAMLTLCAVTTTNAQDTWSLGSSANFTTLNVDGNTTDIFAVGISIQTPTYTGVTVRIGGSDLVNPFNGNEEKVLVLAVSQGVALLKLTEWLNVPVAVLIEHISAQGGFSKTFAFSLGAGTGLWFKVNDKLTLKANATYSHRWSKLFGFEQPPLWTIGGGPGFALKVVDQLTFSADYNFRDTGSTTLVVRGIYSF
ncbi:MAG: hypothetical protein P8P30_04405 [Rickettsiales bacterium]|nr:hypothetical protein [Rickettsiales bacterium]